MGAIMTSWLAKTRVLGPATAIASTDTRLSGTPIVHRLDITSPAANPIPLTASGASRRSHTASAKTSQTSALLPGTMARKPELLESDLF
jgi:hypothetical protein